MSNLSFRLISLTCFLKVHEVSNRYTYSWILLWTNIFLKNSVYNNTYSTHHVIKFYREENRKIDINMQQIWIKIRLTIGCVNVFLSSNF